MGLVFVNPNNPAQQVTVAPSFQANVPAGYIYSGGADGATDRAQQTFSGGIVGGGYPYYGANAGETPTQALLRGDGTLAAYGVSGRAGP